MAISNQQVIPPARIHVKAGFVVYSPESNKRNIVILDEGELAAVDRSGGLKKVVFKMHPGDLVGVASLMEGEHFRYFIEATTDSVITLVSEECMESELKTFPVWLLAVIKKLSNSTRKLNETLRKPRCENTLKSLAEYCSHLDKKKEYSLKQLVKEFHWQTRIPEAIVLGDFKALARRKFIIIQKKNDDVKAQILDSLLLQIYVDYQKASEINIPWAPFHLTLEQKRHLVKLSTIDIKSKKSAPSWIAYFEQEGFKTDVSQWIQMLHLGWFKEIGDSEFSINPDKIKYFLLALRFETNIRGVL